MSQRPSRTPKYRHYRPKDLAVVRIGKRDHYLGKYGSPESHEKYDRLVAEWLVSRHQPRPSAVSATPGISRPITVNELVLAFGQHVAVRYVKNGKPTSEVKSFRTALRPVRRLYGREPVTSFGPLALIACRQQLTEQGLCRKRINQHVTRIRQMFKWGVAREMVPETVWRALCAVEGLKFGEARETNPVKPVPEEHIPVIEPHVTPQVMAMVNMQLWTGCRPGEACLIRGIDLKMDGDVWEYRPHSHKGQHHRRERVIFLGPHAQQIIRPWLKTDLQAYLFSPREARAWSQAQRAEKRKTPAPSQPKTKRKASPKRKPGEVYNTSAYEHAIARACVKAGVPVWAPNRLRHNAGTRIRSEYGIEQARIILGHSSAVTSEIYAEIDREKSRGA